MFRPLRSPRIPGQLACHPLIRRSCIGRVPGAQPAGPVPVRLPPMLLPAPPEPPALAEPDPEPLAEALPLVEADDLGDVARHPKHLDHGMAVRPIRRRLLGPVLVAVLACILLAPLATAGYLLLRPAGASTPAPPPLAAVQRAAADPAGQVVAWVLRNLPGYPILLTDAGMRNLLVSRGYPRADIAVLAPGTDAGQLPVRPGETRLLVITPGLRAAARQPSTATGALAARALANALPLAIFGNGANRVELSQPTGPPADLGQRARLVAARALIGSAGLTLDRAVVPAVTSGRLDLRVASVLRLLAGRQPTELVGMEQDPAEVRAGSPVRVIDIRLAGNGDQLAGTLASLPSALRPAQYTQQGGGYRLVWLPDRTVGLPASR